MQDLPVSTTDLPQILAAIAKGQPVRLLDGEREVAVVCPPKQRNEAVDRSPGWWMRLREEFGLDKEGLTDEECEAMHDRSPGPPPITFE